MRMRRTDLALEARELWQEQAGELTALPGVEARDVLREGVPVPHMLKRNRKMGKSLKGKEPGSGICQRCFKFYIFQVCEEK